tara:strand:- start:751 stop:1197 length:447 start_codon:yes stop_codon:yes gene_type:complete
MRYNINKKKKIKLNIKNIVIFFYLFLIGLMNNLYKYRHYVLVILITILLLWYINFSLKIKEGFFKCIFGSCNKKKEKTPEELERERIARLVARREREVGKFNWLIYKPCILQAVRMPFEHESEYWDEFNKCFQPHDVRVDKRTGAYYK